MGRQKKRICEKFKSTPLFYGFSFILPKDKGVEFFCHFVKNITSRLKHLFRGEILKYKENNLMGSHKRGEKMRNKLNLDCQIMSVPPFNVHVILPHQSTFQQHHTNL